MRRRFNEDDLPPFGTGSIECTAVGTVARRTVASCTAAALTLPALHSAVPTVIAPDSTSPHYAEMALRWYEAGLIDESSVGTPKQLVEQAVQKWVDQHASPLKACFKEEAISFGLQRVISSDYLPGNIQVEKLTWYFTMLCDGPRVMTLGESMAALDKAAKGLFQAAYEEICQSPCSIQIMDPDLMGAFAGWYYFRDAKNDAEFAESLEEMGESIDNYEMLPSVFFKDYPDWARGGTPVKRSVMGREKLENLARRGKTPLVRKVAKLTLEIRSMTTSFKRSAAAMKMKPKAFGFDMDRMGETLYYPLLLRWSEDDRLVDLYDDRGNDIVNCGESEEPVMSDEVPVDPIGFRKWKALTERAFAIEATRHSLINLIGKER